MDVSNMTPQQYRDMIKLECGEDISLSTAKVLMEQEMEHHAEAVAGGWEPRSAHREPQLAVVVPKPFGLYRGTLTHNVHTDAVIGHSLKLIDSFYTREDAEAAAATMYADDEIWYEVKEKS